MYLKDALEALDNKVIDGAFRIDTKSTLTGKGLVSVVNVATEETFPVREYTQNEVLCERPVGEVRAMVRQLVDDCIETFAFNTLLGEQTAGERLVQEILNPVPAENEI